MKVHSHGGTSGFRDSRAPTRAIGSMPEVFDAISSYLRGERDRGGIERASRRDKRASGYLITADRAADYICRDLPLTRGEFRAGKSATLRSFDGVPLAAPFNTIATRPPARSLGLTIRTHRREEVDSYGDTRSSCAGDLPTRPEFTLRPAGSLGSLLDNKSLLMIYPYLCSYRALCRPEASLAGP